MLCLGPIPIKNQNNQNNYVPCGTCPPCYREKMRARSGRLAAEIIEWRNKGLPVNMATLTLAPEWQNVSTQEFVEICKRWRTSTERQYQRQRKPLKVTLLIERGKNSHQLLHCHATLFGMTTYNEPGTFGSVDFWKYGHVHEDIPTPGRVSYFAGHDNKAKEKPIFRSRTRLGTATFEALARSFVNSAPPNTWKCPHEWKLPLDPTKAPVKYPWSPYMQQKFRDLVTALGGSCLVDDEPSDWSKAYELMPDRFKESRAGNLREDNRRYEEAISERNRHRKRF